MNTQKLFYVTIGIIIAMAIVLGVFILLSSVSPTEKFPDRGKYIYDDIGRLDLETKLSLSSYLLGIDKRSGYELVVVYPDHKLDDNEIIDYYNKLEVGKKGKDNGAALFIFQDNSWFMAIGSGNDKISVPYSKTQGDRILKSLNTDSTLSTLRYVDAIGQKLDEPSAVERAKNWSGDIVHNMDLILAWLLILALVSFLWSQRDGYQDDDLIVPIALFIALLVVVVPAFVLFDISENTAPNYEDYGVILSTHKTSRVYTETVCSGSGKSRSCHTVWHTEYKNDVGIESYELKHYRYIFTTTDNQGAWGHNIGEIDRLSIQSTTSRLVSANSFSDRSGGKMIGDGIWG